jgi:hypothetical protein
VGSALEIQPELNALGHRGEQALASKALRDTKYPEQEDKQDSDDDGQFPEKILIHDGFESKN